MMRWLFRLEVRGLENLPQQGPFVMAANHSSNLDPFVMAASLPYAWMERTYWAGSVDLFFRSSVMRLFSRISQTLPVSSAASGSFTTSLAFGALTLKKQKNLVWFPEGRLSPSGEILPFRQGLGIILNQYPAMVVPIYIQGTYESLPRGQVVPKLHPVVVTFGRPCHPQELLEQGQGEQPHARIVQALHDRVIELAPPRLPEEVSAH
ncbi:MAG: 1-acyl-sn-glycerol-3-phosphate acyltransferase [Chloroflexaceae bacterium]|nr:1-acyl-sn-glycerol-3-phosphate acyltransferase [Chloroflexaceae bacterium]